MSHQTRPNFRDYFTQKLEEKTSIPNTSLPSRRGSSAARFTSNSTNLTHEQESSYPTSLKYSKKVSTINPITKATLSARFSSGLHVSGMSVSTPSRPYSEDAKQIKSLIEYEKNQKTEPFSSLDKATDEPNVRIDHPVKAYGQRKIPLKAPLELPAWNVSTKPRVMAKKPPVEDAIKAILENDVPELDSAAVEKKLLEAIHNTAAPSHKKEYSSSRYQSDIASLLLPSLGEEVSHFCQQYFITQIYGIQNKKLNLLAIQNCIRILTAEYPILKTTVSRNSKIIDADVNFFIDNSPQNDINSKYVQVKYLRPILDKIPMAHLIEAVEEWKSSRALDNPFGVLVLEGPFGQFVVFGCSTVVMDEMSLLWLTKKFFSLYASKSAYKCEESVPFEDFVYQSVRTKSDLAFWRDQCIEISQDTVNPMERLGFEKKLKALKKEIINLKSSLETSTKRKAELEKELSTLRRERMAIDSHKNESPVYLTDPTTGNVIEMTKAAKVALIKTVLGEEATSENVMSLLQKHDVSQEIQQKIDAESMSLEEFSTLSLPFVESLNLPPKDRRKLLALAEYVRNRIKECIQEQGKVKFALERCISKLTRSLESSIENLNATKQKIDSNQDMTYRLYNILHPPFVERTIRPLAFQEFEKVEIEGGPSKWGAIEFVVDGETVDNLRQFQIEWTNNIRNKKRKSNDKDDSDNDSLLESDEEDGRKDIRLQDQSVGGVCLAAFGVLMRHITGVNTFLIGVNASYRSSGSIVGPLSDILPVKMDLSKKNLSFSGLFTSLYRIFKSIKTHGPACPRTFIAHQLKMDLNFPIQFQYVSKKDFLELERLGFTEHDVLMPQEAVSIEFENVQTERLWSENPQENYDIKFIMLEKDTTIRCSVRYLKDKHEEDKVMKWVAKFQSTLEGIDCSRRKLSVTSMITRFYNPIWKTTNSGISTSSLNSLSSRPSSMYLFSQEHLEGI